MIYINAYSLICALGSDKDEIAANLCARKSPGMQMRSGWLTQNRSCMLGGILCSLDCELADPVWQTLPQFRCKNNAMLLSCLQDIRNEAADLLDSVKSDRVGVILGSSTSGINETEKAYLSISSAQQHDAETDDSSVSGTSWHFYMHELGGAALFVQKALNLRGPAYTISTACTSSLRAIISGCRLIKSGICDVVIAGGADSLSRTPINGFDSMGVLSPALCTPFAAGRQGINIGEAAGLMVLSRQPAGLAVAGYGESSDAYHASAPQPSGEGAVTAMQQALAMAGLAPDDLGYINLHGTATKLNDEAEAAAVARLFGAKVPCSSTKHLTGHALGAAGITETALLCLLLERSLPLPPQDFSASPLDEGLPQFGILSAPAECQKPFMLTNSLAFGGNNASLVVRRA